MSVEGWRNYKHALRHADKILPEESTPVLSNQLRHCEDSERHKGVCRAPVRLTHLS